jgi:hypothetical protein
MMCINTYCLVTRVCVGHTLHILSTPPVFRLPLLVGHGCFPTQDINNLELRVREVRDSSPADGSRYRGLMCVCVCVCVYSFVCLCVSVCLSVFLPKHVETLTKPLSGGVIVSLYCIPFDFVR